MAQTDLFKYYLKLRKETDCDIMLVRLGDFYEAFGDDAKVLADALDLTLTHRSTDTDERTPMTGFPLTFLSKFLRELVNEKGLNVSIVDDLNSLAKRG